MLRCSLIFFCCLCLFFCFSLLSFNGWFCCVFRSGRCWCFFSCVSFSAFRCFVSRRCFVCANDYFDAGNSDRGCDGSNPSNRCTSFEFFTFLFFFSSCKASRIRSFLVFCMVSHFRFFKYSTSIITYFTLLMIDIDKL
ncbi:autolysin [Listeria monocytogenes]|nr:autolysin [Listeria monocytogenes]